MHKFGEDVLFVSISDVTRLRGSATEHETAHVSHTHKGSAAHTYTHTVLLSPAESTCFPTHSNPATVIVQAKKSGVNIRASNGSLNAVLPLF